METEKEIIISEYLRGILSEIFGAKLKYMDEDIYPDVIIADTISTYNETSKAHLVTPNDYISDLSNLGLMELSDIFADRINSKVYVISEYRMMCFKNSTKNIVYSTALDTLYNIHCKVAEN